MTRGDATDVQIEALATAVARYGGQALAPVSALPASVGELRRVLAESAPRAQPSSLRRLQALHVELASFVADEMVDRIERYFREYRDSPVRKLGGWRDWPHEEEVLREVSALREQALRQVAAAAPGALADTSAGEVARRRQPTVHPIGSALRAIEEDVAMRYGWRSIQSDGGGVIVAVLVVALPVGALAAALVLALTGGSWLSSLALGAALAVVSGVVWWHLPDRLDRLTMRYALHAGDRNIPRNVLKQRLRRLDDAVAAALLIAPFALPPALAGPLTLSGLLPTG